MNIRTRILPAALALLCLVATGSFAQEKSKGKAKSYTFHGKVAAVTEQGLTVKGEKVEGWMDAMTMTYPVWSGNQICLNLCWFVSVDMRLAIIGV
jgi:hypothetical protein